MPEKLPTNRENLIDALTDHIEERSTGTLLKTNIESTLKVLLDNFNVEGETKNKNLRLYLNECFPIINEQQGSRLKSTSRSYDCIITCLLSILGTQNN